jgi:hypothetical protein
MTCNDANPYPDGTLVLVKLPQSKAEEQGDRAVVAVAARHDRAAVRPG